MLNIFSQSFGAWNVKKTVKTSSNVLFSLNSLLDDKKKKVLQLKNLEPENMSYFFIIFS